MANQYGNVPRMDDNINKLDGVIIHDGIPKLYFMQTWAKPFLKALGTKTQDGYTLLAVYHEFDFSFADINPYKAFELLSTHLESDTSTCHCQMPWEHP